MESELIAGSIASVEGIWLVRLAKDFKHDFVPIPIFTDNQSFIAYSTSDPVSTCTKHVDTHYHYTRDQIEKGSIVLHYISTLDNPADILTTHCHRANMSNSSILSESHMFEGVCYDKQIPKLTLFYYINLTDILLILLL
jgi:hypothetical protein